MKLMHTCTCRTINEQHTEESLHLFQRLGKVSRKYYFSKMNSKIYNKLENQRMVSIAR